MVRWPAWLKFGAAVVILLLFAVFAGACWLLLDSQHGKHDREMEFAAHEPKAQNFCECSYMRLVYDSSNELKLAEYQDLKGFRHTVTPQSRDWKKWLIRFELIRSLLEREQTQREGRGQ